MSLWSDYMRVPRTNARAARQTGLFSRHRVDLSKANRTFNPQLRIKRPLPKAPTLRPVFQNLFKTQSGQLPQNWQDIDLVDFHRTPGLTLTLYQRVLAECTLWQQRLTRFTEHQVGSSDPTIEFPLSGRGSSLNLYTTHGLAVAAFTQMIESFFLETDSSFRNSPVFEVQVKVDSRFFTTAINQLIDQFEDLDVISISETDVRFLVESSDGILGQIIVSHSRIYERVIDPVIGISARELLQLQDFHNAEMGLSISRYGDLLLTRGFENTLPNEPGHHPVLHTHPRTQNRKGHIFPSPDHGISGDLAVIKKYPRTNAIVHALGLTLYDPQTHIEFADHPTPQLTIRNTAIIPTLDVNLTVDPFTGTLMIVPNQNQNLPYRPILEGKYWENDLPDEVKDLPILFEKPTE